MNSKIVIEQEKNGEPSAKVTQMQRQMETLVRGRWDNETRPWNH